MSIRVMSMIWKNGPEDLKERMVLLAIADHADEEGCAYPGVVLIAEKTCMDKRTVLRWLAVLEAGGWMTIDRKSSGTGRKGNTYYLNLAKLGDASVRSTPTTESTSLASGKHAAQYPRLRQSGQATKHNSQVTKAQGSGDKTLSPILSNHQESSLEPSRENLPRFKVGEVASNKCGQARLAEEMLERLAVVAPAKTRHLASEAIRLLAKAESMTLDGAATVIEERACIALHRGNTVNAFWFEDGKWKAVKASPASIGVYRPDSLAAPHAEAFHETDQFTASTDELALGQRCWDEMKFAMQKALPIQRFDTWVRPLKAIGAVQGVLLIELPSTCFEGVDVRHQFDKYLPDSLTRVQCVMAETLAA